jgi:phospholipase B1, membrane-associated
MYMQVVIPLILISLASASLCPPILYDSNRSVPESVVGLRPGDFGLVMAMGDSITAAFSANNKIEEYRGASFSIGGDDHYEGAIPKLSPPGEPIYSIPNLLKIYNPKLRGFSVGIHGLERPEDARQETDYLNAAQSTARVQHMIAQVDYLYGKLTSGEYGDADYVLNNVWKHLTLFIGANNICGACGKSDQSNYPETYEKEMNLVLEELHNRIPRLVVSLISIPHFSRLRKLEPTVGWCRSLHIFYGECSCVLQGSDQDRKVVDQSTDQFNQILRNLYGKWRNKVLQSHEKSPSFAVLLHPFNEDITIPNEKYLSTLDCFHPSAIAHENFAIALWNSLFIPFANKTNTWDFQTPIYCPKESDLIRLD